MIYDYIKWKANLWSGGKGANVGINLHVYLTQILNLDYCIKHLQM